MAKTREKVQQLGFWDTEVSKPDHDAVCLWAYENAEQIFRVVYPDRFDKPWLKDEIDLGYDRGGAIAENAAEMARAFVDANPRPNPRITKKILECVLTSHTGYQDRLERIVGYADLLMGGVRPIVTPQYEYDVSGSIDKLLGYELNWTDKNYPAILVEAKSVLPTVGELMRQIQLYRTAFNGKFVVVSPDDKYAQILSEQGVIFIKYPH